MRARNGNGHVKTYVVGSSAFVPTKRTAINSAVLYIKTHASVGLFDCDQCKAKAGSLCLGDRGPTVTVHMGRRSMYKAYRRFKPADGPTAFVFKAPVEVV